MPSERFGEPARGAAWDQEQKRAAHPRSLLLPVVVESLRWHEGGESLGDDAVLNACRALRWARTGEWSSKPAAGRWALERELDPAMVRAALAARDGGPPVDSGRAAAFVAAARRELQP